MVSQSVSSVWFIPSVMVIVTLRRFRNIHESAQPPLDMGHKCPRPVGGHHRGCTPDRQGSGMVTVRRCGWYRIRKDQLHTTGTELTVANHEVTHVGGGGGGGGGEHHPTTNKYTTHNSSSTSQEVPYQAINVNLHPATARGSVKNFR